VYENLYGKPYLDALEACRARIDEVEVDRTKVKPVVKITGEFWASITEGDGNFNMFRFLEREGAHFDTQIVERDGKRFFLIAESNMRPINDEILGSQAGAARLAVMDAEEVFVQAVSCVPFIMYPGVAPELGQIIAQISNNALVAFARSAPERFAPIASVPIQAPDLAARELERVAALGARGVMIPPLVNGRGLDEPDFEVFWQAAEAVGRPDRAGRPGRRHPQRLARDLGRPRAEAGAGPNPVPLRARQRRGRVQGRHAIAGRLGVFPAGRRRRQNQLAGGEPTRWQVPAHDGGQGGRRPGRAVSGCRQTTSAGET